MKKKILIFYSGSKSNSSINNFIFDQVNKKFNHEIINLSSILTEEMFEDEIHLNKLGHKNIARFISEKIIEKLK